MKKTVIILSVLALSLSSCGGQTIQNNIKMKLLKSPVSDGLGTLDISFNQPVPLYRTENDTMPFDTLMFWHSTLGDWSFETKRLKSFNPYEMFQGTITLEEDAGKELPYYPPRLAFRVVEATNLYWRVVVDEKSFETVVIHKHNSSHIYKTWGELSKLSQNNYLNEEWYFETNIDKNLITVSHSFDESGKYECRRSETHEHYHEKANGTYFFQPETNEIFIHIEENWIGSVVMDVWIQKDYKQYFLILEMTDSTVKVRTIPSEYELDWFIEKGRYYIKIINTDQDFDEFPPFEEKPKYYKRILKK